MDTWWHLTHLICKFQLRIGGEEDYISSQLSIDFNMEFDLHEEDIVGLVILHHCWKVLPVLVGHHILPVQNFLFI